MSLRPFSTALRGFSTALAIALAGCAAVPPLNPKPSQPGEPVATPWQCEEIIERGGRC